MTVLSIALHCAALRRMGPLVGFAPIVILAGCSLQRHEQRPIDPVVSQAAHLARRSDDAALRDAMSRLGIDTTTWPLPAWDAPELSALALSSHPDLAVARAEMTVARSAVQTARQRANPGLELSIERHSEPGSSDSPWSIGIAVDTLVGEWLLGDNRRQALTDTADARQLEAVERAARVAWQVHRRVRDSHRALHESRQLSALADETLALQREESTLWQRRMALGAAGAPDVLPSQQRQAIALREAHRARQAVDQANAALAQAIGLPLDQTRQMPLQFDSLKGRLKHQPDGVGLAPTSHPEPLLEPLDLQRAALLNNIAVRIALARYAATDATLRLEIARQLPEFSLKPGYAWDQGDHRWSLGIGYALPLSNRNDGPIAEARAQRAAEAARFDALQAQAISELDAARLAAKGAAAQQADALRHLESARTLAERVTRRVEQGDADRSERITARRLELDARRALIEAQAALDNAHAAIEDVVQRPLPAADRVLLEPSTASMTDPMSRLVTHPRPTDSSR